MQNVLIWSAEAEDRATHSSHVLRLVGCQFATSDQVLIWEFGWSWALKSLLVPGRGSVRSLAFYCIHVISTVRQLHTVYQPAQTLGINDTLLSLSSITAAADKLQRNHPLAPKFNPMSPPRAMPLPSRRTDPDICH
jgi:hypothetical protein